MNSSFLYHAWGLYSLECTREEYKGNTIILHVQSKKPQKTCPKCGKNNHRDKNAGRNLLQYGTYLCETGEELTSFEYRKMLHREWKLKQNYKKAS